MQRQKNSLKHLGRDVKKHLTLVNGYRDAVIKDVKNKFKKHGYRMTLFIFWTKDLIVDEENKKFALNKKIALRDYFDLNCYKQAYKILEEKEIVRNNFLKDIELQLKLPAIFQEGTSINVDAVRTQVGSKKLYTFLLDVSNFLKFAYVFRIETSNILASYQRLLKRSKIRKIQEYLQQGDGYFPNNVIVTTNEDVRLTNENTSKLVLHGTLKLPNKPAYLEVIDGQHRLYGYTKISDKDKHHIVVTVIKNLNDEEKAKLFITINKNQTPVPAYLLWDLYSDVEKDSTRGKISRFVKAINNEQPFKNLIRLPRIRSTNAYLSFSSICFVLNDGIFRKFGAKENFNEVVRCFFSATCGDSILGDDWRRGRESKGRKGFLGTNVGISVQFKLLNKVLEKTGVPPSDELEKWKNSLGRWIIQPLKEYLDEHRGPEKEDPYGNLRATNASEGSRRRTAEDIFNSGPLSNEDKS